MLKVSGLQLVKPNFDWECSDKLTEIEQFKADCRILFDGPLSDLEDKQKSGLIVNWLGREATQILTPQMKCSKHWKRYLDQSLTKH